jgi:hypothetical protein
MGIAVQCLGLVLLASAGATPWDAVQAFRTAANPSEAWSWCAIARRHSHGYVGDQRGELVTLQVEDAFALRKLFTER